MRRFVGRPWMASAFTAFVMAALSLFIFPPLWFVLVAAGLAMVTLDMTRSERPPPPED